MSRWNQKITDEEVIFLRKLGFTTKQIATLKNINYCNVYKRAAKLANQGYIHRSDGRGTHFKKLAVIRHEQSVQRDLQLVATIEANGGMLTAKEAKKISWQSYSRVIHGGLVFRVELHTSHSQGSYKRGVPPKIFKKGFHRQVWICSTRTAMVRLFQKACLPPEDDGVQQALTFILRRYLTKAETIAVLWKLGDRNWSHHRSITKRNMQINGVMQPLKLQKRFH